MSYLLEEAVKLYEDIQKTEGEITILKEVKEEKTNLREDKIDEFIETQIIPPAKSEGYEVYGRFGVGERLLRWENYKGRFKKTHPTRCAQVVLYKNNNIRLEVFIYAIDKLKVELVPLLEGGFGFPQRIQTKSGYLTWMLNLDSPQDSLKQYIKKYETEIYIPQKKV